MFDDMCEVHDDPRYGPDTEVETWRRRRMAAEALARAWEAAGFEMGPAARRAALEGAAPRPPWEAYS